MSDSPEDTGGITGIILARIEVKLDTVLSMVTDHEARIRSLESHNTVDHGARLTALERFRHALPTTALIVSALAIAGAVVALLGM